MIRMFLYLLLQDRKREAPEIQVLYAAARN
jgi:hypothetical protein